MISLLGHCWRSQLSVFSLSACPSGTCAAAFEAFSLTAVRWTSTRRGKRREFQNYDVILESWRRSQQHHRQHSSGNTSQVKQHARKHSANQHWCDTDPFLTSNTSSRGRKGASKTQRQQSSRKKGKRSDAEWQGGWHSTWSNAARAQAAAAAQLDPEELHNLVFGRGEDSNYSGRPQSDRDRRRQRRKARRMRGCRGAAPGRGNRDFSSCYAYAEYSVWSDEDSDDDEKQFSRYSQQHCWGGDAASRPDWQWWTEEQERQWFEQSWQQHGGQKGWQQQQRQGSAQTSSSSSSQSNNSSRPWWEHFQQTYQQQQHQQRQQQQRQSAGDRQYYHHQQKQQQQQSGSSWQQHSIRHPQAVLNNLSLLGLPASSELQLSQLKAAFHKAAMQWHPDKHADQAAKAAAEVKFKQVKEAYESLLVSAAA